MEKPWFASYDPGVPRSITYPEVPLVYFLTRAAERFPTKPALIYYGRSISYQGLNTLTNRFANALLVNGVKKEDRVALMLPNIPQAVIGYYGTLKAGAIAVEVNPLSAGRELEQQLSDAGVETIVILDRFFPKVQNLRTPMKRIIVTGAQDFLPFLLRLLYPLKAGKEGRVQVPTAPPLCRFLPFLKQGDASSPPVQLRSEDVAMLQYTGGTTGIPKGVMLTHRNLVANVFQARHWFPDLKEGEEVMLAALPFFHVYGMTVCMNLGILLASTLVLVPQPRLTEEVLKAAHKHRVTLFPGVPAMYAAINNHPDVSRYDLKSIKVCVSGAGPLHPRIQERFEALTGGRLVEGYGLSEASPVTHCNPALGKRKVGSIGLPLPDTDARIVDMETGEKELPVGEAGELIIRGPQVMKGYWKNPEEETKTLRNGWLYTGDIARMDEEGFFYIVDRKKEMIKTFGENVYPREVEDVLFRHPKIKEAAVVGIPYRHAGEIIKAYVVLKEGETATEEEIIAFCEGELAKFKVPRKVEFRQELPKTLVGKVLRRVLKEEELKRRETLGA